MLGLVLTLAQEVKVVLPLLVVQHYFQPTEALAGKVVSPAITEVLTTQMVLHLQQLFHFPVAQQ